MTASVVVVIAGLRAAAPLLTPFMLAVFIAIVSLPVIQFLRRLRFPTGLAILSVVLLTALGLSFFGWIVFQAAVELREELPGYLARLQEIEQSVRARLLGWGVDLGPRFLPDLSQPERVIDLVTSAAMQVTSAATVFFLILLFLIFILSESVEVPKKLRLIYGPQTAGLTGGAAILQQVQRYLVLKTIISLITGVAIGVGAALLGVDFAVFWGLLAFVLNYIPNIGSVIAAIPAVAVALLQLGVGHALGLAAIFLAVNMVVGNLIDVVVMGRELRLSPLIVLMSLVFWGWVWGPVGLFLAVPLTIVTRIVMEQTDSLTRVAQMMGRVPKEQKQSTTT